MKGSEKECDRTEGKRLKYEIYKGKNKFNVLTAANMKFRVFWNVAPCSHVAVDRRFRDVYCLHHQGDRYIPEFTYQKTLNIKWKKVREALKYERNHSPQHFCVFTGVQTYHVM
jgi:hypothetical protein